MIGTIIISIIVMILIVFLAALSILPAAIAIKRRHPYKWAITALTVITDITGFMPNNVLWITLGSLLWVGILIWSLMPIQIDAHKISSVDNESTDWTKSDLETPQNVNIENTREVSTGLLVGIILAPLIYAWATLREGYSKRSRILSFGYAGLCCVLLIIFLIFMAQTIPALRESALKERQNAQYAKEHKLYMMTTPEEIIEILTSGNKSDLEKRIIVFDGTITEMYPKSGHTEITIKGRGGAEIELNGDYIVGIKNGDAVSVGCSYVFHFATKIHLDGCLATPQGQYRIPWGANVRHGRSDNGKPSEDGSEPPLPKNEPKGEGGDRSGSIPPEEVISFDQAPGGENSEQGIVTNPFVV